jgi:predicted RNA-binding protein with EMAP domain
MESFEGNRSKSPENGLSRLADVAFTLQPKLALLRYHELHPEEVIDIEDPMKNEKTVRDEAMQEWVLGEEPYAVKFRSYISDGHEGDVIDIKDVEALKQLLQQVTSPTLH